MTFYTGTVGGQSVYINGGGDAQYSLYGAPLISPFPYPDSPLGTPLVTPPGTLTEFIRTGSFTLPDFERSSWPAAGPYYVQLIITPQSATPEPSTLLLFATGMMGVVGAIRRRVAQV